MGGATLEATYEAGRIIAGVAGGWDVPLPKALAAEVRSPASDDAFGREPTLAASLSGTTESSSRSMGCVLTSMTAGANAELPASENTARKGDIVSSTSAWLFWYSSVTAIRTWSTNRTVSGVGEATKLAAGKRFTAYLEDDVPVSAGLVVAPVD